MIRGTCGMSFGKIVLSVSSFFLFVLERYRDIEMCVFWDVWSNFRQSIAIHVCTWLIGQRSHKNCKYSWSPFDCLLRCFLFQEIFWKLMHIWGCDFFNMMHMFSLYIPLFGQWAYSNLLVCPNYQFDFKKKSSGKVCFHPVATSSQANSLSALDTVHRRIPETSLVLWFSLLQLRQLEGRKHDTNSKGGRTPSYLGKEAMVFVPPFNKQLKRA